MTTPCPKTNFPTLLQQFFLERLIQQRNVSPQTVVGGQIMRDSANAEDTAGTFSDTARMKRGRVTPLRPLQSRELS
jgi:hypothetical protein